MRAIKFNVVLIFLIAAMDGVRASDRSECPPGSADAAVVVAAHDFRRHLAKYRDPLTGGRNNEYLTSIGNYNSSVVDEGSEDYVVIFLPKPQPGGVFKDAGAVYLVGGCGSGIKDIVDRRPVM